MEIRRLTTIIEIKQPDTVYKVTTESLDIGFLLTVHQDNGDPKNPGWKDTADLRIGFNDAHDPEHKFIVDEIVREGLEYVLNKYKN